MAPLFLVQTNTSDISCLIGEYVDITALIIALVSFFVALRVKQTRSVIF